MIQTSKVIKKVAFFGDGEANANSKHYKLAYKTAGLVAKNGYIIVNGGGPGVMLASTLGAKKEKGRVELVMIKKNHQPMGNYEGQSKENVILADKKYEVASYVKRIDKLAEVADIFLIFEGGTGTLAELGYVWSVAKFEYGNHEPIIFVGEGWKKIINMIDRFLNLEKIERDVVYFASDEKQVVKILTEIVQR